MEFYLFQNSIVRCVHFEKKKSDGESYQKEIAFISLKNPTGKKVTVLKIPLIIPIQIEFSPSQISQEKLYLKIKSRTHSYNQKIPDKKNHCG